MNKIDMSNLPPEVAAYIRSLERKNEKLEQENKKLQGLTEQLVKMRKRMFGQSSEQVQYVNGEQLNFFNEAEAASDSCAKEPGKDIPVKAHQRKPKATKADLTEGLEHKKTVLELPDDKQICRKCGSRMVNIGEKFIRSELVIVSAQSYCMRFNRQGTVNRANSVIPTESKVAAKMIGNRQSPHQPCIFCHEINQGMCELK